ncbi:hypothetical protein BKK51_04240 [Rodentibacter trehalosifermentans]|uniref:PD-(D/E)XK nuclease n=1 Tax=Rodentibacter trehalosifermentans TaxID=1908263 RepID=A0A1V3IUY9_9PAST|nr:PD-(D/E)XK nuclease family protein [Rodentibacter trehalosifermentans]OOF46069.1 hypothetical protein BKK51_04240 [Rodentibacter trehalosifermentans]
MINIDVDELTSFFEKIKSINFRVEKKEKRYLVIDLEKMKLFFTSFDSLKQDMQGDIRNGMLANVWGAANLKYDEVKNSKVLRYFLDSKADHGQGDRILMEFLSLLKPPFSKQKSQHYFATEECCPLGEQKDRVDIEIDAENYLMFIEVKISALEGKKQLERYINAATAKSHGRDWCVVYLTLDGIVPEDHQDNHKVIGVSWKDVAHLFSEYGKDEPSNLGAWLLRQFAKHIKTFY